MVSEFVDLLEVELVSVAGLVLEVELLEFGLDLVLEFETVEPDLEKVELEIGLEVGLEVELEIDLEVECGQVGVGRILEVEAVELGIDLGVDFESVELVGLG